MLVVIALGGNALLRSKEKPSFEKQEKNAKLAAKAIKDVSKKHKIVVTHGNGPQVGNIMLQVEAALGKAYPVPLHVAVAESEGEIGFLLEQALHNELRKPVVTVLTQVIVAKSDPAFGRPTKPIGPFYTREQAKALVRRGYSMVRLPDGWRRVVASPRPLRVVEADVIKRLANAGVVPIAAGGGGIPVYEAHGLRGIDAVIDKDLASACLAKSIGAKQLIILTDVDAAYMDFGKKNQKALRKLKAKEARRLMAQGHFQSGSMGPKIEAALSFAESGGTAIITNFASLSKALRGKAGTTVVM